MRRLAAGLTLVAALALSGTAAASGSGQQGPAQGDQVNPGSPAGQEYVIPIPAARNEAAGGAPSRSGGGSTGAGGTGGLAGGGSVTGGGSAPLFGIGVTPTSRGAGVSQASNRRSANGRAGGRDRGTKHGSTGTSSASRPVSLASVTHPGPAGGDGWLALVGGGLLVLAVGGGAGIVVRRRLTGS